MKRLGLLALSAFFAGCAQQTDLSSNTDAEVVASESALSIAASPIVPEADTSLRRAVQFGNDGQGTRLGVSAASIVDLERTLIRFSTADVVAALGTNVLHKAEIELTIDTISVGWAGGRIEILPMTRT